MIINILLVSICIGFIAFIGCCFSKNDYLFEKSYFVGLTTASICFIILLSYFVHQYQSYDVGVVNDNHVTFLERF